MNLLHASAILTWTVMAHSVATAQAGDFVELSGTVHDPSGRPIAGLAVRGWPGFPFDVRVNAVTDSAGRFRVAAVPRANKWLVRLLFLCPSLSVMHPPELLRLEQMAKPGERFVHNVVVDLSRCPLPIADTLRGTFRGYWRTQFEESRFTPCPGAPGASLPGAIWAQWAGEAEPNWSEFKASPDTSDGAVRFFVEAQGWLHGPGDYGHLGMSPFQLEVVRLLTVTRPERTSCES